MGARHTDRDEVTPTVVAALGPTNTGKTHRAIERMLEHESGVIGLPLRLLAREVYDRLTARLGEEAVALVTGEERRVPSRPAYWVCTVEAMPQDRLVDFLAVDEIQLAAHRERGHVFTERLLHARGRLETWFLGSDTMRDVVRELVPGARFERCTRMSQLRHAGEFSLRTLPPRSAVVAFSAAQVYELAERLRRLRGGVAVVLGALSPRTRNAQVAMYQSGEVSHLVATDAIGMGLNLDVDHVAFAGLAKFDGFEQRELYPSELAQIAGRAGRHLRDGTFGTLRPVTPLSPKLVQALENHRFAAVQRLIWRNVELDYSSLDALHASLSVGSPHHVLQRIEYAEDFAVFKHLASLPEIQERAQDATTIAVLWQVCQVPNFRKQLVPHHGALLKVFFEQLHACGHLDEAYFAQHVRRLDQTMGDIALLTERLSEVRVWAYVCQRPGWLPNAEQWQARVRQVEEQLGDALHQKLVERFVARQGGRRGTLQQRVAQTTQVDVSGPFAQLATLWAPAAETQVDSVDGWVARVEQAEHEQFVVDSLGFVRFEDELLARLVRGKALCSPGVALVEPELWTGGAQRRLQRRLHAFSKDLVAVAQGGPGRIATIGAVPEERGLAYALTQGLGVLSRAEGEQQWRGLAPDSRRRFKALGFRMGRRIAYLDAALSREALVTRGVLARVWWPRARADSGPAREGPLWVAAHYFEHADQAVLYGYSPLRGLALRMDIYEGVGRAVAQSDWQTQLQPWLADLKLPERERMGLLGEFGLREQGGEWVRVSRRRRAGRRKATPGQ